MGIKTKFCPMGGKVASGKGNLSLWRYSNNVISGKTLLFNYVGSGQQNIRTDYPSLLYVPKAGGKAIINDWYNASSGSTEDNRNTPFYNNPYITNVDLQGVPFRNNSMDSAFRECINLISAQNIPSSITNMDSTFYNCYNLNQNIQIPNGVTDVHSTFYGCRNLNQNIQIPNGVTTMTYAFHNCHNLNQNIRIPNSVTTMDSTFSDCRNLNQNIQISNSVKDMHSTFYNCFKLNQNIRIPNSVTTMSSVFYNCYNLNQNIRIPNSVKIMYSTFYNCQGLSNNWINIESLSVGNATRCFNLVQVSSSSNPPSVFIISKSYLGVFTNTYNAFKSAGWTWNEGNVVGTIYNCIRTWSLGYSNADCTFGVDIQTTSAGTDFGVALNKWHGKLDTFLNNNSPVYRVNVPKFLGFGGTSFTDYPAVITNTCFQNNSSILSINCNNAPMFGTAVNAFRNTNADIVHCIVPNTISNVYGMFCNCGASSIQVTSVPNSTKVPAGTAYVDFPDTITNIRTLFDNTNHICNHYVKALSITGTSNSSWHIFGSQKNKVTWFVNESVPGGTGNVQRFYLLAPNMTTVTNLFSNYSNTLWKKLYIYYTYANGVNTKTFNTIKNLALYKGTSGNGAGVMPLYNSTSKFAVYDYGNCPV